jgi:homocysteine S-methyltransferase
MTASVLEARDRLLLLDGAVGTELVQRGADLHGRADDTDEHDDYWTGRAITTAPAVVRDVHRDYIAAGADLITTNSFRTNPSSLGRVGETGSAERLTTAAVRLAIEARAAARWRGLIGGSIGPIDSCYSPERAPDDHALAEEHGAVAAWLAAAGADVILPETMNSSREAAIAAAAAGRAGRPCLVSFALRDDGRLHTGERLAAAAERLLDARPLAVLVNHCRPALVGPALAELAAVTAGTGVRFGARPHLEKPSKENRWTEPGGLDLEQLIDLVRRWIDAGATVVGGCCGATPRHIAALSRLVEPGRTDQRNGAKTWGGEFV